MTLNLLSPAEDETLYLTLRGFTREEVAVKTARSVGAVASCLDSARRKLRARSVREAVERYARSA